MSPAQILDGGLASASRRKPMICSSEKRFFTSNLLSVGIELQIGLLLKIGGVVDPIAT